MAHFHQWRWIRIWNQIPNPIITLYYAELFPQVQIQIRIPVWIISQMVTVPIFRDASPSHGSKSESVSVGGNEPLDLVLLLRFVYTRHVTIPVFVKVSLKVYHCANGNSNFDGQSGFVNDFTCQGTITIDTMLKFDGLGHVVVTCKQTFKIITSSSEDEVAVCPLVQTLFHDFYPVPRK